MEINLDREKKEENAREMAQAMKEERKRIRDFWEAEQELQKAHNALLVDKDEVIPAKDLIEKLQDIKDAYLPIVDIRLLSDEDQISNAKEQVGAFCDAVEELICFANDIHEDACKVHWFLNRQALNVLDRDRREAENESY